MSNGSRLFSNMVPNKPHLGGQNRPDGLKGEVGKLRADVAATLAGLVANTVDEFTNPAAASVNSVKLAVASSTSAVKYRKASDFDGALGPTLSPPRPVSVTCSNSAPTWVGSITVKGLDVDGKALTETIALTNNATTTGLKCFAKVLEIDVPAQADLLGTFSIGHDAIIGLSKSPVTRAGLLMQATVEVMDGALIAPVTGVLSTPAAHLPHGAYTPAAAPNGAHDYAIYYEYSPLDLVRRGVQRVLGLPVFKSGEAKVFCTDHP